MTAYKLEEFSVRRVAEKPFEEARLRSHVAEKRATRVSVLRKACRVTLHVAAALFVLDRSLGRPQERLLEEVDRDL